VDDSGVKQRLAEERARLEGLRGQLVVEHHTDESAQDSVGDLSSIDQHQADAGTETFEREKDLSILESIEAELADVEHALRRLDEGTYGVCEACGKPIGVERLEAMPAARLCLDDQAQAERQAPGGSV
jgi:RNA polymerase-binding protein DksA